MEISRLQFYDCPNCGSVLEICPHCDLLFCSTCGSTEYDFEEELADG